VAWLDDLNLLVQVPTVDDPRAWMLVLVNIATGQITQFARGAFLGLYYP
jgi:hypothetical protein